MIKNLIIQHKFKSVRDGSHDSLQDYVYQKTVMGCSYSSLHPDDVALLKKMFKEDNRLPIIEAYTSCYVGNFFKVSLEQALHFMSVLSDKDTTTMLPKLNYSESTFSDFRQVLDMVHRKYPDADSCRTILYLIHERVTFAATYDQACVSMDKWISALLSHAPSWSHFQNLLPFEKNLFFSFDEACLEEDMQKKVGAWVGHAHSAADNFQKWEMMANPEWNKETYSRLWHAHTNGFKIEWHPHYEFFIAAFTVFNGALDIGDGYFSDASTLMKKEDNLYLF